MTGDERFWNISLVHKRWAVPTILSGFPRRTCIHQLHNGILAEAPSNQSSHPSGYSNIMFASDKNVSPTCSDGDVFNKRRSVLQRFQGKAVPSDLDEWLILQQSHSSLSPVFPAWIHQTALTQLKNGLQLFHL